MKIHILQHVHYEGPGYITEWAEKHGHTLSFTKFFEAFTIPLPIDIDLLIVLGGPMGVDDTNQCSWLLDEKDYIRQMAKKGRKILGICLGAQLIASGLGAAVYPCKYKEIGWFPVKKDAGTKLDFLSGLADEIPAFHWHGDTFNLPVGAKKLFSSEACANQGFVINECVFALQFHWELTKDSVRQMIEFSGDNLDDGPFVQAPETLLATKEDFSAINQHMEELLDYLESL